MPTKCCWVIHGSLTSERKASTSPSSFINHSTLLLNRALKRQAPCLYMHFEVRALDRLRVRTRRRVGSARRRGNHMHDHSRFQRDINDVTDVSLSLPLTKVTDAQYRKRFRAYYNMKQTNKLGSSFRERHCIACFLLQPPRRTANFVIAWSWISLFLQYKPGDSSRISKAIQWRRNAENLNELIV